MKKLNVTLLLGLVGFASWLLLSSVSVVKLTGKALVYNVGLSDLLESLGDTSSRNPVKTVDNELVSVGQKLIFEGKANYKSTKGKRISTYFVCTDCHNMTQEYPTLTDVDPQVRLDYAVENNIAFLPGSTLHGIYNRQQFYTKDYEKKYGELIKDAQDTLENAIQVCAKYCSSGRFLEDWEEQAILHYFKDKELRLIDLDLTDKEKNRILTISYSGSEEEKMKSISWLKEKYTQAYIATFLETKPKNERNYGKSANADNGQKIYEKSCLHCHDNARVTYLDLDKDVLSAGLLWKHRKDYTDLSPYQIIRHGTYPITGRKQYMPLYTEEKMSKQQVEDLVAYIKKIAKK